MKQKILFLVLLIYSILTHAQLKKSCDAPEEESLADLNSITKCSIKPTKKGSKKTKQISVRISANKRRFRKTRKPKPVHKKAVNDGNALSSSGIASTNKSLKVKNDLISFKNTLSEEQVKNAKRFMHVDKIPTFKKCKSLKDDDRLDCFNTEMVNHINDNLQYPSEAVLDNIEGEVWIRFIIDSDGTITNIKTLGLSEGKEILDQEAMRVVSKLPAFEPGELNGKKIPVKYGFPINFSLNN